MENVYETFFFLKYSGGWSFSEAYSLPVGLRNWFAERLIQQLEAEKEAIENSSKSRSSGNSNFQLLNSHNQPKIPQQFAPKESSKK
jgi:hypothetical protein